MGAAMKMAMQALAELRRIRELLEELNAKP